MNIHAPTPRYAGELGTILPRFVTWFSAPRAEYHIRRLRILMGVYATPNVENVLQENGIHGRKIVVILLFGLFRMIKKLLRGLEKLHDVLNNDRDGR
jgi:hypothetical protein